MICTTKNLNLKYIQQNFETESFHNFEKIIHDEEETLINTPSITSSSDLNILDVKTKINELSMTTVNLPKIGAIGDTKVSYFEFIFKYHFN